MSRLLRLAVSGFLLCTAAALHAETVDRMVLSSDGVVLEVSSPASGIMRIRLCLGHRSISP